MHRLVAHFDIRMPGQPLIAWPDDKPIVIRFPVGRFDVEILLETDHDSGIRHAGEAYWTRVVERASVKVSTEETELPPEVRPDEQGRMDYSIQDSYLRDRRDEFGDAAHEAINRLIRYWRYRLRTPLLEEIPRRPIAKVV
jgi:hypothetical protein